MDLDVKAAISFLRNNMYSITDKLARESTKPTGNNYYVSSANGLYYTVMHGHDITNATEQLNQAIQKKKDFGKGNTRIYSMWADIIHPLWKSKMNLQFAFNNVNEETWGSLTNGLILNNNANGSSRRISENKLNVLCAYVIHEMLNYYVTDSSTSLTNAEKIWSTILRKFDDNAGGYADSVSNYRESYKQALVKYCSKNFAELRDLGEYQEATGMWAGNLQDATSGGIYARYIRDSNGNIVNNGSTYENTESTCAILLGYLS